MSQPTDADRFKQLYRAGEYSAALEVLEKLIAASPGSAPLYWHQANCLEKLERHAEVPHALNHLLARKPDYVPALIKRVEYSDRLVVETESDPDSEKKQAAIDAQNEKDLRYALELDPQHAQACFLLANLLRYRADQSGADTAQSDEAKNLLDRAIDLAPDKVEYLATRAETKRLEAIVQADPADDATGPLDPSVVQTFSGIRYRKAALEAAVADFKKCWQIAKEARFAVKLGTTLHDLGRYDEALQHFDDALQAVPADDPRHEFIREMRSRSENHGAGEREQMAKLLLSGLADEPGKNRTQQDHMAAQAIIGAAKAIRRGDSVATAIATNISDDPDTMMAMNLARQILNVANEPPPGLVTVNAADFPAYQRQHCDKVAKEAQVLGLTPIADAEASTMFDMLGQHVLLRIFTDDSGEIGMASYTMKPKWPGLIAFLFLVLTGKWKAQKMIECVTQFDDGTLISTQPESISPFEFGGQIMINKLPAKAGVTEIFQKHAASLFEYRTSHPQARPMQVKTLEEVEARWVAGQAAKAAYRKSIGYVTEAELRKMLGGHYGRFSEKILAQIRLMAP